MIDFGLTCRQPTDNTRFYETFLLCILTTHNWVDFLLCWIYVFHSSIFDISHGLYLLSSSTESEQWTWALITHFEVQMGTSVDIYIVLVNARIIAGRQKSELHKQKWWNFNFETHINSKAPEKNPQTPLKSALAMIICRC